LRKSFNKTMFIGCLNIAIQDYIAKKRPEVALTKYIFNGPYTDLI